MTPPMTRAVPLADPTPAELRDQMERIEAAVAHQAAVVQDFVDLLRANLPEIREAARAMRDVDAQRLAAARKARGDENLKRALGIRPQRARVVAGQAQVLTERVG